MSATSSLSSTLLLTQSSMLWSMFLTRYVNRYEAVRGVTSNFVFST